MTDSADFQSSPDSLLHLEYARLASDIARVIDIDAGLRDVLVSGHHGHLAGDIASVIDVEAGLAAAMAAASDNPPEAAAATYQTRETTSPAVAQPVGPTRIGLAELTKLDLLMQTRSGTVWRVGPLSRTGESTTLAYLEFGRDRSAQGRAARAAVTLRVMASEDVRAVLDRYFAWPRAVVNDESGVPCGALIPLPEDEFLRPSSDPRSGISDRVPRLMRELAGEPGQSPDRPDMLEADRTDRIFLVAQLVYAVAVLHKLGWVLGDLSFDNIAVAVSPPRMKLLDCDGAAPLSDPDRQQASSVNWDPPEYPITPPPGRRREVRLQDTASDVYKLGLLILRLLTPGPGALSSRSASRLDGELPPEGTALIRRALSPDRLQRPTAKDLYGYLRRLASSLAVPPSVTSARLTMPFVIQGSDARVEWQLEHAASAMVTVGGQRERVDLAAHTDGYSMRPERSGPVSLEVENRFGTVKVNLGYLDVVELPEFSFNRVNLPRIEFSLPLLDLGPQSRLDLSAVPRPELPAFDELAAVFRSDSAAKQLPGRQ